MRFTAILIALILLIPGIFFAAPQQRKPKAAGDPTLTVHDKGKKIQKQMKKKGPRKKKIARQKN